MLKTEVPQDLFSRVMGSNPSRNAGRTLPVDSVNWIDRLLFTGYPNLFSKIKTR
jgi:hypothetical protein